MKENKMNPNTLTYNSIIFGFGKKDDLDTMVKHFDDMKVTRYQE